MLGDIRQGYEASASVKCLASSEINGRGVWFYELDSPIGAVQIVQREEPGLDLTTWLFYWDHSKAGKFYTKICKGILEGKW